MQRLITLLAAGLLAAGSVLAGDLARAPYIAPQASWFEADDDRLVEDDFNFSGGQFAFGKPFAERWNWEFAYQKLEVDNVNGTRAFDQDNFYANLLNIYNRDGRFSPYILAGIGFADTDFTTSGDDDNFQANGGLGVLSNIFGERISLRTEVLARWENTSPKEVTDYVVNVGFQVALGEGKSRVTDSDGDGVPDGSDRCPGTLAGVAVDASGCELDGDADGVVDRLDQCPGTPRGVRVDARGCGLDSDGDGVPDGNDQCPGTVRGAVVDARGCEMDDDGDGVVNRLDQCPNTKQGVMVDVRGCEIKERIRLPNVNFRTNSAQLLPTANATLDEAAATLDRNPSLVVEVAGHTDSDGEEGYNQWLSERRANAVRDYLIGKGIAPNRLTAKGYGETQPVADNRTRDGKAENRRVVLRVLSR